MWDLLFELGIFTSKSIILVIMILLLLAGILALLSRGREKKNEKLCIKKLNKKYAEYSEKMAHEIFNKTDYKNFSKSEQEKQKKEKKSPVKKNIYVLNFHGDIKGSAIASLREEVTAILNFAKPRDEIFVNLESPGGQVHAYGLGAAQLERIKRANLNLTVCVDKVAASGGYMMASVADKIIAAPFAVIGSIGVLVQMPNFHRLLQEKNIDFEQVTAGYYKRTLTLFGKNTDEAREKLQKEINIIHELFKNLIKSNRKHLDIEKVSTGEYWMGTQALELNLVDEINTSDDYLLSKSKHFNIFEVSYHIKKPFSEKLTALMRGKEILEEPLLK